MGKGKATQAERAIEFRRQKREKGQKKQETGQNIMIRSQRNYQRGVGVFNQEIGRSRREEGKKT